MTEIERKKTRKSKGDGTEKKPFTYSNKSPNVNKNEVIQEGAQLTIQKALEGKKIHFEFETGSFSIQISCFRNHDEMPIFHATSLNQDKKSELIWPSLACSIFTFETIKMRLEKELTF